MRNGLRLETDRPRLNPPATGECTEHLIPESAEALVRCANDKGEAQEHADTLRAELSRNAEREGNTDPDDGR